MSTVERASSVNMYCSYKNTFYDEMFTKNKHTFAC